MLLNVCNDIGLEVNIAKVGHHGILMANEHITEVTILMEKVKTFKCLGSLLVNQISTH